MTNNARGRKAQPTASSFRRTAMASAVALAMTPVILQSAYAQTASYSYTPPTTRTLTNALVTGYIDKYVGNDQLDTGLVIGADISNVFVTATYITGAGGTTVVVSGNSTTATSIANEIKPTNSIDLLLMQPTGSAGILSSQIRAGLGGVPVRNSASQSAVTMGVDTTAQNAATITVTGNSIASEVLLNQQRSTISGSLPANYSSPVTTGSATNNLSAGIATAMQGSIGINSNQASSNAGGRNGSISTVSGSRVTLDLDSSATNLSSPLTLSTNSISADYTGNDTTNTFAATGGSPSFRGTIAVNNTQANLEFVGAGAVPTALVTTSEINADVTSRAGIDRALTAPLVVNSNSVSTTSTGNAAGVRTDLGIAAGNSITIANGISVTGNTSPTVTVLDTGSQTNTVTGDIVMLNTQGNFGTYFTSQTQGSAATPLQGGVISTRADSIGTGGSVTSNSNAVTAGATGNLSGNVISATNSSFNATVGAANYQNNNTTSVTGTVNFGSVTVNVGDTTSGPVTGAITANSNRVAASAEGSVAANSVSITSTNLTSVAPAGVVSAQASIAGNGAVAIASGTSIANLQTTVGAGAVSSTVYSSFIAANAQGTAAVPLQGFNAATVTLDSNTIDSSASGNSAGSVVALGGTLGTAQAAVANAQINTSTVSGRVLDSGVLISSGEVTATGGASTLTLSNNTVSSSGVANDAFNAVGSTLSGLTLPGNALSAAATASVTPAGYTTSNAAFAVSSSQNNTAAVSSLTENMLAAGSGGGFATIYAGTGASPNVTGSTLSVTDNDVTSTTRGNVVNNGVTFGGSTLETTGNAAMAIASIASAQSNAVTGVANATVHGLSPAVTGVGITYAGALTDTPMSVTGNNVAASTVGNDAVNRITTAGGTLTSAAPVVTTGSINTTTNEVNNELSIANVQRDAVSAGRTALVERVTLGISQTGAATSLSNADLTVDGNQMIADARNNNAANNLNLTGYATLSTGVGVLNSQTSSTNVAANVTEGRVRIRATGVAPTITNGSSLILSDNVVQGQATGSVAGNTVTARAGTLSGNANLTTSGVTAGTVNADYGIANSQTQTGTASAFVSSPLRITAAGATYTDSSAIASDNTASALAQGTSAANTLALGATSGASSLTAAIGSAQTTSGAVTATVRPEPITTTAVIAIDGTSFTNTPVTVTGNRVEAGAGQNSATNALTVRGAGIAGQGIAAGSVDFVVDNAQTGSEAVTALALPGHTGLLANAVANSVITVTGNVQLAAANVNAATNSVRLASTSGVSANGATNNSQAANSGAVSATVGAPFVAGVTDVASIGVAAATVGDPSPDYSLGAVVTVNGNTLRAQASRNTATNTTTVGGAGVTGSALSVYGTTTSFATLNTQAGDGDVTGTAAVGVIGTPVGTADASTITVNGNSVSAAANVNQAMNTTALSAVSTFSGTGLVANTQTSPGGALSATTNVVGVGTIRDGLNGSGTSTFTSSPVSVAGNVIESQAGRNSATNALTAEAATLTGSTPGVLTSFESRNTQTAVGAITSATTVGTIGSTANSAADGSFTVAGNRASSLSNANTATNSVAMTASSAVTGSGLVNNLQTADTGAIGATVTTTTVGLQSATVNATPVSVAGNILNAEASRNIATNTLTALGSTVSGTAAVAPAGGSFTVLSNQTGNGNVVTTNSLGLVGSTQTTATAGTTFGVVDNLALAASNVNIATNRLVLNAVSALTGTGAVSNTQTAGTTATAVSATVGGTGGTPATVGVTAFVLPAANSQNGVATTVTGNTLAAQGGGNTASNYLEAAANSSIGGSVTFPTYGVLNAQTNNATVTTTVSYANIGNTVGGTATGVTTTVSGNQAAATSYGNSATNSLLMSALAGGLNTASASINNTQVNGASMSATVTGVSIGMNGGGTIGGSTTIVNNAITARAVGNSGSNVIGVK